VLCAHCYTGRRAISAVMSYHVPGTPCACSERGRHGHQNPVHGRQDCLGYTAAKMTLKSREASSPGTRGNARESTYVGGSHGSGRTEAYANSIEQEDHEIPGRLRSACISTMTSPVWHIISICSLIIQSALTLDVARTIDTILLVTHSCIEAWYTKPGIVWR
jgi:hypothetical protein